MIHDNLLHISQSQAEAFHIVQITCMHAIELLEYLFQILLLDADAVILDGNHQFARLIPSLHRQLQIRIRTFILHCIIHEIENHIGDMHLIGKNGRVGSFKLRFNLSIITLHFQCKRVDNTRYQLVGIQFLILQSSLLTVKHRHLKHFFYLEPQALRFIVDDTRYMLEHSRRLAHSRVFQHLCRQRNRRYRRLELVRHIVDEIILHLRQLLLAEYDVNRKDERHQQYKSKYHRRYHKPDRIEDIILLSRKMYLDDTHTGWWVIQKQWLRIRAFTPCIAIIRTTVYLPTFPVYHLEVIIHITETILYQTCF